MNYRNTSIRIKTDYKSDKTDRKNAGTTNSDDLRYNENVPGREGRAAARQTAKDGFISAKL